MESLNTADRGYWNRIQVVSFLLAVFIIMRHNSSYANYEIKSQPALLFSSIHNIIHDTITELAVPMFFIISGVNYFHNYKPESFIKKTKRRLKSLLIPYIVWNSIYCAFCLFTSNSFVSRYFLGREKYVFAFENVLWGCLLHWKCNAHFWFVFNLMIFSIMNGIMYYIIKDKKIGSMFIIFTYAAIFLAGVSSLNELLYRMDSIFYYYIGAFIALHFKNNIQHDNIFDSAVTKKGTPEKRDQRFQILHGLLLVCTVFLTLYTEHFEGVKGILMLLGCKGLWDISIVFKSMVPNWIPRGGTVFLMYAAHGIIQPVIVKSLYIVLPKNDYVSIVNYILSVSLTVIACVLIRQITSKYFPVVDSIVTGERQ